MMKKLSILLVAIFTMAFVLGPYAAASNETIAIEPTGSSKAVAKASTAKGSLPKGIVPRTDVPAATDPIIEVDNDQARLLVRYKAPDSNAYKVIVDYKGSKQYYKLYAVNADEYFPLSGGNGDYTIMIARVLDASGTKASVVKKASVTLNAKDKNAAYLSSNYYVKWEPATDTQKRAQQLTKKQAKGATQQETIYQDVVKLMNYDFDMVNKLPSDYTPDLDTTLKTKKGVCFDTAALLAGMLRSTGTPTRLVMGYAPNVKGYHAWNEVLVDGKWIIVDATVDAVYEKGGQKYTMAKNAKGFEKMYQY